MSRADVEMHILGCLRTYGNHSTTQLWHRLGALWPASDAMLASHLRHMESQGLVELVTNRPRVWRIGMAGAMVLGER